MKFLIHLFKFPFQRGCKYIFAAVFDSAAFPDPYWNDGSLVQTGICTLSRIGKEFELDSFPLSTYGEKPEIRASAQWKPAEGSRPGF